MKNQKHLPNLLQRAFSLALLLISVYPALAAPVQKMPILRYELSFPQPQDHTCQVTLYVKHWPEDTLSLKMPQWMPGYYQLMNYAQSLENLVAKDQKGQNLPFERLDVGYWRMKGLKNKSFSLSYLIRTKRKFVATSYVDSLHAYLVPGNTFLYPEGHLQSPVSVKINPHPNGGKIATGLAPAPGKTAEFSAPNFDILYDCPILVGPLEELPAFQVGGVKHRFIGYQMGSFDRAGFMQNLQKVVQAGVNVIGDIPFPQYTFIGIGPGRGGIEHLNNTTVSFDGSRLNTPAAMNTMMNFLAHEYFHHYNVKRIRPLELGPFAYDRANRTQMLWVSEGLTVYYEYLIVKRAGLADASTLFKNLEGNINNYEKDPGRQHQSVAQASYYTWEDGPFGGARGGADQAISYYDKGPILGLFLDFTIRHATQNTRSIDDVMRLLYQKYYQQAKRGFSDSEFQQACEQVAGSSLSDFFAYIYNTAELDYARYLGYAGLKLERNGEKWELKKREEAGALEQKILRGWLGE